MAADYGRSFQKDVHLAKIYGPSMAGFKALGFRVL